MSAIQFEVRDLREKPPSDRLPQEVVEAIHEAVGAASLSWRPTPGGIFDAEAAAVIADNLCHFVADRYYYVCAGRRE